MYTQQVGAVFQPAASHNPNRPNSPQYYKLSSDKNNNDSPSNEFVGAVSKWKRRISWLRAISRIVSAITNVITFAFMAFVIAVFLSTRDDSALGRPIWPREPKTWPTILLLTASLITLFASLSLLVYYCLCFRRAVDSWKAVAVMYAIEFGIWLTVTFLYRYEKALSDLWGWSCTDIAKDLQARGNIRVDFANLCRIQTASWVFSIFETSTKVLFALSMFFLYRKVEVSKARRNLAQGVGEGVMGVVDFI
ncbi:hypothetical protein F5Y19DRAFT_485339 [Xylariaceae sp. FL1651]|nr:hypothetical protein F5Y19DRAFT_485339 [Xylariaceae sp. FL1651]